MSRAGRVVTVTMVIDEPDKANWIWDSAEINETHPETGVRCVVISNGNVFDEKDILKQGLQNIAGRIVGLEEDTELEDCYDEREKAELILERADQAKRKYDYDPVLCQYNHGLEKTLPSQRKTSDGATAEGPQDTP